MARFGEQGMRSGFGGLVHGENWCMARIGGPARFFRIFFADVWLRRGFGGFVVAFGGFVVAFGGFVVAFGGFFVAVFCTFHKVSKFPICAALSSDPQRPASFRSALR